MPLDSHERGGLGPRGASFDVRVRARGKKKKKKPGSLVMHVDADWSDGLCEVRGLYWSLAARSDLESDRARGLGARLDDRMPYIKSKLEKNFTLNIPFLFNLSILQWSIRSSLCRIWKKIPGCRRIKDTVFHNTERGTFWKPGAFSGALALTPIHVCQITICK